MKKHFSHPELYAAGEALLHNCGLLTTPDASIFPVPHGGVPVAYLLKSINRDLNIVNEAREADVIVDDVIDSGVTRQRYGNKVFGALHMKQNADVASCTGATYFGEVRAAEDWLVYPWERAGVDTDPVDNSIVSTILHRIRQAGCRYFANDNIADFIHKGELATLQTEVAARAEWFLQSLLIDTQNDHNTKGTAERVAKMYLTEVFKGRYTQPPAITSFPNDKALDEMYVTGPLTLRSACSHHFVPIVGKVWIGIVPGDTVIGLSKFGRIVDWIASRPQIQEEMVVQIADTIQKLCKPKGLAVVVHGTHMCTTWRGVRETMENEMKTSVVRGVIKDNPAARAEFFSLINGR